MNEASERDKLRGKMMTAMSPLCNEHSRWYGWPGTWAFAEAALSVLDAESATVPAVQRIDPEALILACVPGGYSCDPQAVADAIRAYFAAPQAVQQSDTDPLTKLTRLSEEMGLYDEGAQVLYEHDDGRHAVAPNAEAATFAHGDPAWHRVGPVAVYGVAAGDGGQR